MTEQTPPPAIETPTPSSNAPGSAYPAVPPEPAPQPQRMFGMLCHLLALAGITGIPLANILGPLIIWLIKKPEMPFVDDQGKESLNFQITVTLALLICVPLICVGGLGFLLAIPIGLTALVFVIIAAIKANEGVYYRYPLTLRLIK
jgi:hypothetical protein